MFNKEWGRVDKVSKEQADRQTVGWADGRVGGLPLGRVGGWVGSRVSGGNRAVRGPTPRLAAKWNKPPRPRSQ